MQYQTIPNVPRPVSRLIFGTSNPRFRRGDDCGAFLDELVRMGITAFDTARVYGKAERVLGQWMSSRGNREEVVILSKGGHPALFIPRLSERAIRRDLSVSCRELQTDRIDIYLLHRDDPRRPAGEYVEILNALHAEGRIGAFGGSNWTQRRIEEANEYAYRKNLVPFTVSSPYFGLADMKGDPFGNGAVSIAGHGNEASREWYRAQGMAVCAYSALGSGFFSGRVKRPSDLKGWPRRAFATEENFERLRRCEELARERGASPAQIALAWALAEEMNVFAIVTSTNLSRMRLNLGALAIQLSEEERRYLDLK